MTDHLKRVSFVIQYRTGIWHLWHFQDILFHRTHKYLHNLHQDHHIELSEEKLLTKAVFQICDVYVRKCMLVECIIYQICSLHNH